MRDFRLRLYLLLVHHHDHRSKLANIVPQEQFTEQSTISGRSLTNQATGLGKQAIARADGDFGDFGGVGVV